MKYPVWVPVHYGYLEKLLCAYSSVKLAMLKLVKIIFVVTLHYFIITIRSHLFAMANYLVDMNILNPAVSVVSYGCYGSKLSSFKYVEKQQTPWHKMMNSGHFLFCTSLQSSNPKSYIIYL